MSAELIGRRLGVYQLHERVGAGGMGEVYRARDTRLQRDVAVKILPEVFAADSDRRTRFEREARVLASLNHPNIATIHGIEDEDGVHALVMELVEGETIADRIVRGPLPVSQALTIARQIADALDAAHERGIVHRDLKPANIKLTSSGLVKVLDFGLAKAVTEVEAGPPQASQAATVTAGATQDGLIVGTPAYMSPEQMRGQPVDKRTDIWAFGCVLYEMITRNPANDWHPVWSADGTQLLFNSDRAGAAQGMLYVKRGIDVAAEETRLLDTQSSPTDWSRDGRWMAMGGSLNARDEGNRVGIVSSLDRTLKPLIETASRHGAARFSPDGKWVAYSSEETGRFEVFVRPFANGTVGRGRIQISESGGDFPVWRPDGQEIYFMSEDATIHAVPAGALRVDGPVPRPQTLFRPCPGSVPQGPPMSAQF